MIKQCTLKNVIRATGIGVHSGKEVQIVLNPAPANTGIVFRRIDLTPPFEIPARLNFVTHTSLQTSLQRESVYIRTPEHLLSALAGLGIDNLYIDLNSEELPIMDGSSAPFVFLLQSAGIDEQNAPKSFLRVKKKIVIEEGDKRAQLEPCNGFKIEFEIDYKHPLLHQKNQTAVFDLISTSYIKEISRARTFGFLADYDKIKSLNLAQGASLENTLVLDDQKVMNDGGFRYPDECVKHKILDVIGDLSLLGYQLIGAYKGYKASHAMNAKLMQALMEQKDAWELVSEHQEILPFFSSNQLGEAASS